MKEEEEEGKEGKEGKGGKVRRRVRDVTCEKNDFYVYDESIKRER